MAKGDKQFKVSVQVPQSVRHDPAKLRAWLDDMAKNLQDSTMVAVSEPAGDDEKSVNVTMRVRPCGARV